MIIMYVIFTLLFYLYIILYVSLGFVQPIGAIIRLLSARRLDSEYAIGLKKYLLGVVMYFFIMFFAGITGLFNETFFINCVYLFLVPWFYAIWYIRHIRKWKEKRKNIVAFDKLQLLNAPHEDRLILESYPSKKINLKSLLPRKCENRKKTIIRQLPILTKAK